MSTSENSERISNLRKFASRLFKDGELVEYRAKCADGNMRGFYFTDLQRFAEVVADLDSTERALVSYNCINPLKGRLIRERNLIVNPSDEQVNQILASPPGKTASNDDIDILRWIFIDVDTVRAPHLKETDKAAFDKIQHECSTDEEKAASKQVALKVLSYLRTEKGWPQGIICDSGNGWHLLFRMNLQNTPTNYQNHGDVLKALKAKFDCSVANIDSTVYNPARLTRAYGSTTRKGTNTPERPYRPNFMTDAKGPVGDVTIDQILNIAVESPGLSRNSSDDMPELAKGFEPYDLIDHYVVQGAFTIDYEKEWNGNPILATSICLFQGRQHSGDEFKSGFVLGDTFGYKCFSDDCDGLHLQDALAELNKKYTPYDKPIFEMDRIAVAQTFKELLANGDVVTAEDGENAEQKAEVDQVDAALAPEQPAPEPTPVVASTTGGEPAPEPEPESEEAPRKKASEALDDLDIDVNNRVTYMLGILLNHPEETWQDHFVLFVKRFKEKLGFGAKPKKILPGEVGPQVLSVNNYLTLYWLIKYVEQHRALPDKEAMIRYIDTSTDPEIWKSDDKANVKAFISKLKEHPANQFDQETIYLLQRMDLRQEIRAWREAFGHHLLKEQSIQDARDALKRHFNLTTTQDTNIEMGAWQERLDQIVADFEKDVEGSSNALKFRTGFPSIDQGGLNIGLDGSRAICLYGPASNRKTTLGLSMTLNAAISGKNVLFFAGEHMPRKLLKKLTLQLTHFFRDPDTKMFDQEIANIPALQKWENLNRTATKDDVESIKKLFQKLRADNLVPGYIEPQSIDALSRGDEDKVGAILAHAEATFAKYQWDAIVIDPLDTIMPPELMGSKGAGTWKICSGIIDRLFEFSRNAFGGRGCVVIVSAQFGADARRDIERLQDKNTGGQDNHDDEIESILRRDGLIQYFTTIGQRFDLALGVATRVKDGSEGIIVKGRDREGGHFNTLRFEIDEVTNYLFEIRKGYTKMTAEQAAGKPEPSEAPFDTLDAAMADEVNL